MKSLINKQHKQCRVGALCGCSCHGVAIGRLGPATNLRPAGAHQDRRRVSRSSVKNALRRGDEV